MARRLRTAATLLVLVGILVGGAYYGWAGLTRGWLDDGAEVTAEEQPEESCSTPPALTARTGEIEVSVYNAGAPGGEATEVFEALVEQGFVEGDLGDAPDRIDVEGIVIWPGEAEPEVIRLVKRQFDQVRVVHRMTPLGPGVNVLVGRGFQRLADKAPTTIDVEQEPVCSAPTPSDS